MDKQIYKIATVGQWDQARADGVFRGAPVDITDGFIHFSTMQQVRETAAKHFAGLNNLVLLTIDADALGQALKYEPSRSNALFPHLYADLALEAVTRVDPIRLGEDGTHIFPDHILRA